MSEVNLRYSPGIREGRLCLPSFQYERLTPECKEDFVRIVTPRGVIMWKYKEAVEEINPNQDFGDTSYSLFVQDVMYLTTILHIEFKTETFAASPISFTIDADMDDFDYVQGVADTALANCSQTYEYILDHLYGELWTITIIRSFEDLETL